ncbi:hypothetical protein CAEBREN_19794 [Caenorhabditis brenneri]|uniref:Uncharacterized protein n=1 Tax=Caenorhabditis brenneri TaxID=135651 RepID=G0P514_CAEBE|nr:hypothetical protein CAEBREN_19794 [Caenorhabditis brenneri]
MQKFVRDESEPLSKRRISNWQRSFLSQSTGRLPGIDIRDFLTQKSSQLPWPPVAVLMRSTTTLIRFFPSLTTRHNLWNRGSRQETSRATPTGTTERFEHPNDDVAPSNCHERSCYCQPGKLLGGLQFQDLSPGHYTDSPAPGEEKNFLTPRAILTPEDYQLEQGPTSTAANNIPLEPMIGKGQYVETIDPISDSTDNSSSNNCQPYSTEKFARLETMRNDDDDKYREESNDNFSSTMRAFESPPSNTDGTESTIYGTREHVEKLLEQHRQMQSKDFQLPNDDVAPINYRERSCNRQPGMLLGGLQFQDLSPGHYTDSPALGKKENVLRPCAILTPEDYQFGQGSTSTAANNMTLEPMIAKSQYVETIVSDHISDFIDNSSSNNCQPYSTKKFATLETLKNDDDDKQLVNLSSSRINTHGSAMISGLCHSASPTNLEPRATVQVDEIAKEQTNEEDSYLTGPSNSEAELCAHSANGVSVAMSYLEKTFPAVPTQQYT